MLAVSRVGKEKGHCCSHHPTSNPPRHHHHHHRHHFHEVDDEAVPARQLAVALVRLPPAAAQSVEEQTRVRGRGARCGHRSSSGAAAHCRRTRGKSLFSKSHFFERHPKKQPFFFFSCFFFFSAAAAAAAPFGGSIIVRVHFRLSFHDGFGI